jgi:UDP-N-acetylmuramoyl-tripeptide--D-alanyl-D-alanine ligase
MEPKSLAQITEWVSGTLKGPHDRLISGVSTDSRSAVEGDLFVALRGENFDGHQFVAKVKKATAALVDKFQPDLSEFPQIIVKDTLVALQQLARAYRKSLSLKMIAVTGSNGKTSTKEMIAAVAGRKYAVAKTEGNLNNHIGVPLTLLKMSANHEVGVVEMGMNHAGELLSLCNIASPDIGVITNVGNAHIGNLGSKEAIAAEKAVVAESIATDGVVILNAHDLFTDWIAQRVKARVVRAGIETGEVRISNVNHTLEGEQFTISDESGTAHAELLIHGDHMIQNAALAVAVGRVLGIGIEECAKGLAHTSIPGGRFKLQKMFGLTVMNDAYNANPDSMVAAIRTVGRLAVSGHRVAALGAMAELGDQSETGHRRVGVEVVEAGFDVLVTVGKEARLIADAAVAAGLKKVRSVVTHGEAVEYLNTILQPDDLLLVKGSASSRMGQVIEGLEMTQQKGQWAS